MKLIFLIVSCCEFHFLRNEKLIILSGIFFSLWSDVRNKCLLQKFAMSVSIFVLLRVILWLEISCSFISFYFFYYTEKLEYLALDSTVSPG